MILRVQTMVPIMVMLMLRKITLDLEQKITTACGGLTVQRGMEYFQFLTLQLMRTEKT